MGNECATQRTKELDDLHLQLAQVRDENEQLRSQHKAVAALRAEEEQVRKRADQETGAADDFFCPRGAWRWLLPPLLLLLLALAGLEFVVRLATVADACGPVDAASTWRDFASMAGDLRHGAHRAGASFMAVVAAWYAWLLVRWAHGDIHQERSGRPRAGVAPESAAAAASAEGEAAATWINTIVEALWPQLSAYVERTLRESVEPELQQAVPAFVVHFSEVCLGQTPLQLRGVRALRGTSARGAASGGAAQKRTGPHRQKGVDLETKSSGVSIGMDVVYRGDASLILSVLGVKVGLSDLQIHGRLVIEIPELLPHPPFAAGLSCFFANPPTITADWRGIADIADFWVVRSKLWSIISGKVNNKMLLPNRLAVQFDRDADIMRLKRPRPAGLLRLTVVEARGLRAADIGWTSMGRCVTSDPFVEVRLGSSRWRTACVARCLDPVWQNQVHDFLVDAPGLQDLMLRVYDEDVATSHDLLGVAALPVDRLLQEGDLWVPLCAVPDGAGEGEIQEAAMNGTSSGEAGRLRLRAEWRPVLAPGAVAPAMDAGASTPDNGASWLLRAGLRGAVDGGSGLLAAHDAWSCEVEIVGVGAPQRSRAQPAFETGGAYGGTEISWEEGFDFVLDGDSLGARSAAELQLRVSIARGAAGAPVAAGTYQVSGLFSSPERSERLQLQLTSNGSEGALIDLEMELCRLGSAAAS